MCSQVSWVLAELSGTLSGKVLVLDHSLQPHLTPGLHLTLCPLCPGPTLWLPQGLQPTGPPLGLLLPALPRRGLLSSLRSDTTRQTGHRHPRLFHTVLPSFLHIIAEAEDNTGLNG